MNICLFLNCSCRLRILHNPTGEQPKTKRPPKQAAHLKRGRRTRIAIQAAWGGGQVELADRFYRSRERCQVCGHRLEDLSPNVRRWACRSCGTENDRDLNAAQTLDQLVTKDTASAGGMRAAGSGRPGTRKAMARVFPGHRLRGSEWMRRPARDSAAALPSHSASRPPDSVGPWPRSISSADPDARSSRQPTRHLMPRAGVLEG